MFIWSDVIVREDTRRLYTSECAKFKIRKIKYLFITIKVQLITISSVISYTRKQTVQAVPSKKKKPPQERKRKGKRDGKEKKKKKEERKKEREGKRGRERRKERKKGE